MEACIPLLDYGADDDGDDGELHDQLAGHAAAHAAAGRLPAAGAISSSQEASSASKEARAARSSDSHDVLPAAATSCPEAGDGGAAEPSRPASPLPDGGADPLSFAEHLDPEDFQRQRRRAAFAAMLVLLYQGAKDEEHLCQLITPMSGDELEHAAEERALAGEQAAAHRGGSIIVMSFRYITSNSNERTCAALRSVARARGVASSCGGA